jgi:hypothetical protein
MHAQMIRRAQEEERKKVCLLLLFWDDARASILDGCHIYIYMYSTWQTVTDVQQQF